MYASILLAVIISDIFVVLSNDVDCQLLGKQNENARLTVKALEISSGNWMTTFSAHKRLGNNDTAVEVQIDQDVIQCGNNRYLRINGVLKDVSAEKYEETILLENTGKTVSSFFNSAEDIEECKGEHSGILRFDWKKKGTNVVLSNDYRTANRKNQQFYGDASLYGGVITSRPLHDDELFEVRLDETIDHYRVHSGGIGVMLNPPRDIEFKRYIFDSGGGTWSFYYDFVRKDGEQIKSDYPLDLKNPPNGLLVGVMRKRNGDLHFFKNGVDIGVAAHNVSRCVYGFVDKIHCIAKITIVS